MMPFSRLPQLVHTLVRQSAYGLVGINRFDAICGEMPPCAVQDFSLTFLKTMRVRLEWSGLPVDAIPATGPLIAVANHPYGLIEGMALDALLLSRRPDVTVIAWHLLAEIPEYRGRLIFVDPARRRRNRPLNVQAWRRSFQWLARGGALGVFPAGRVARFRWSRMSVVDRPWNPHIAAMARRTHVPVLPIHFHGHNGWAFQLVGALCPPLQNLLLVHQVNNKRGHTLRATIGPIIKAEELAHFATDDEASEFLRRETEKLARPDADELIVALPRGA